MCRLTLGRFPVWAFLCGRILAGISLLRQPARGPADEARAEDARGGAGGMTVERMELAGELTSGGGATARAARGRTTRDSRSRSGRQISFSSNKSPANSKEMRKKKIYKKITNGNGPCLSELIPLLMAWSYQTKRVGPSLLKNRIVSSSYKP